MMFLGSFAIAGLIVVVGLLLSIAMFGIGAILRLAMWLVTSVLRLVIFLLGRVVVWSIRGVRLLKRNIGDLRR